MNRNLIFSIALVLSLGLVGCSHNLPNVSISYFSNFTAEKGDGQYSEEGTVHLNSRQNAIALYVDAASETQIYVSGEMERRSGEALLTYIQPDGTKLVVADSHTENRDILDIGTLVKLDAGLGYFLFEGEKSVFDFNLLFDHISDDDITYLSNSSPDDDFSR